MRTITIEMLTVDEASDERCRAIVTAMLATIDDAFVASVAVTLDGEEVQP